MEAQDIFDVELQKIKHERSEYTLYVYIHIYI